MVSCLDETSCVQTRKQSSHSNFLLSWHPPTVGGCPCLQARVGILIITIPAQPGASNPPHFYSSLAATWETRDDLAGTQVMVLYLGHSWTLVSLPLGESGHILISSAKQEISK